MKKLTAKLVFMGSQGKFHFEKNLKLTVKL